MGIGGGLDGKILLKAWVPGEGPVQAAGGFADALLIVKVEGGGVLFDDFLELLQGDEGPLHGRSLLYLWYGAGQRKAFPAGRQKTPQEGKIKTSLSPQGKKVNARNDQQAGREEKIFYLSRKNPENITFSLASCRKFCYDTSERERGSAS